MLVHLFGLFERSRRYFISFDGSFLSIYPSKLHPIPLLTIPAAEMKEIRDHELSDDNQTSFISKSRYGVDPQYLVIVTNNGDQYTIRYACYIEYRRRNISLFVCVLC